MTTLLSWILMMTPLLGLQADETPASAEAFAIRTVLLSVSDANGIPLEGLGEEDFEVEENGVGRDIVEVEGGRWQEIFLLFDTSAAFREGIPSLRKGVEGFAAALREPQSVLLADFGGALHHLAGPTSDPDVLVRAAARMTARTEEGFLMDAMAELCSGVAAPRQTDAEPPALVIVTGLMPDASATPLEEVHRLAIESGVFVYVILYDPPEQTSRFERRAQMENFLATLAQRSGGRLARILAAASLPDVLGELGAELMQPRYRVSFLTEIEPPTSLENLSVRLTRDGARLTRTRLMRRERVVSSGGTEEVTQ
ncbi:MAG: hypothetical protein ACRD1X_16315 [Vicinamibacteria bacterium]